MKVGQASQTDDSAVKPAPTGAAAEDAKLAAVDARDALIGLGEQWYLEFEEFAEVMATRPPEGSLAHSDLLLSPRPIRSPARVATVKLANGYDALRALSVMWTQGQAHMVADYVLLRSMFESSLIAWWVLAGSESAERIARAQLVELDEMTNAAGRERRLVAAATTEDLRNRRNEIGGQISEVVRQTLADYEATGGTDPRVARGARLNFDEIIAVAQRTLSGIPDAGFLQLWTMLNGFVHGSSYSVMSMASRDNRPADLPEGIGYLEPDIRMVISVAQSAHLAVEAATRDLRGYLDPDGGRPRVI